jgi:hypothetical protein
MLEALKAKRTKVRQPTRPKPYDDVGLHKIARST